MEQGCSTGAPPRLVSARLEVVLEGDLGQAAGLEADRLQVLAAGARYEGLLLTRDGICIEQVVDVEARAHVPADAEVEHLGYPHVELVEAVSEGSPRLEHVHRNPGYLGGALE